MYQQLPGRPAALDGLAVLLAHVGTLLELAVPMVLLLGPGGDVAVVAW